MKVILTPELAAIIEEKVRAGEFSSADNAVNSLLSYIVGQEKALGTELADLRAKIAVGVAQAQCGQVTDFDPDAVWEEVERRYAQQQQGGSGPANVPEPMDVGRPRRRCRNPLLSVERQGIREALEAVHRFGFVSCELWQVSLKLSPHSADRRINCYFNR